MEERDFQECLLFAVQAGRPCQPEQSTSEILVSSDFKPGPAVVRNMSLLFLIRYANLDIIYYKSSL